MTSTIPSMSKELSKTSSLCANDTPGFWEGYGYHNYGDPWREQRYWSD